MRLRRAAARTAWHFVPKPIRTGLPLADMFRAAWTLGGLDLPRLVELPLDDVDLDRRDAVSPRYQHPDRDEQAAAWACRPAGGHSRRRAVLLASVVVAEIEYGIAKSGRRQHNRKVFDTLLAGFQVLPFDAAAARLYGPIRANLEKRGRLIGPYDLMIAAHARSVEAVLVTDNTEEFGRVAGLKIENWPASR